MLLAHDVSTLAMMPAKRNTGKVSVTQAGTVRSSADVSLGQFMHEAPSIHIPTYAAGGIPAGQEDDEGQGAVQSCHIQHQAEVPAAC